MAILHLFQLKVFSTKDYVLYNPQTVMYNEKAFFTTRIKSVAKIFKDVFELQLHNDIITCLVINIVFVNHI